MWITFIKTINGRTFHHLIKQLQALHDWKNMRPWTLSYHLPQFQETEFVSNRKLGNHLFSLSCYYLSKVNICLQLLFFTLDSPTPLLYLFRECNSYKLIEQEISSLWWYHIASWKMYNLTIKSSTKVRVRKSLDCKIWSGLKKVTWSTFHVPETQWGKEIIVSDTRYFRNCILYYSASMSTSEKDFNLT